MRSKTLQICLLFVLPLCTLVMSTRKVMAQEKKSPCDTATGLLLNETFRSPGLESGHSDLFGVEIKDPGILVFDVAVPGFETAELELVFGDRFCSAQWADGEEISSIAHLPQSQILAIKMPGIYFLQVTGLGRTQSLSGYLLSTHFLELPAEVLTDELIGGIAFNKSEDDEIDVEEWIDEVLSITVGGGFLPEFGPIRGYPFPWCDGEEGDEHGDTIFCATQTVLGKVVKGELRNPWHDDHDYFTFTLEETMVVEIESTGHLDTFGVLYDRFGNRLAAQSDGGTAANFHIVKVLVPGRYFVRLEGASGDEGPYRLHIRRSESTSLVISP